MYCLSSFCCCCLTGAGKLQDINKLDVDGLPYIDKLIFVSFGHEAIDFKIIRYICLECIRFLQLAYKFKRSCLINHELLQIYSGQLKYFTGRVNNYEDLFVDVSREPEKIKQVADETVEAETKENCNENEIENENENVESVENALMPADKAAEKLLARCTICDELCPREADLQLHYTTKHQSLYKEIRKRPQGPVNGYECAMCLNKVIAFRSLIRHIQIHGTRSPQKICKFCQEILENNDAYKKHIKTVHACRAQKRCYLCKLTLENDFQFRRHMFIEHTPRKCTNCEETFFTNTELRAHLNLGHLDCDKCGKRFTTKWTLRKHMSRHETDDFELELAETPEVPETPEIPPEVVPQTQTSAKKLPMFWHLRRKCTNCLNIFSCATTLKRHKCFNLVNMFQCNNCYIIYSKKSSFINHVSKCTTARSAENSPELEDYEMLEPENTPSTTPIPTPTPPIPIPTPPPVALPIPTPKPTPTPTPTQQVVNIPPPFIDPIVKNENDLDIKEEILEDFFCNSSPKLHVKIPEIRNIYTMTEAVQTPPKEKQEKLEKQEKQEKSKTPKIKLRESEPEKPKRFSTRRKSCLFEDMPMTEKSELSVDNEIDKKRKNTQELNETFMETESNESVKKPLLKKRRQSVWLESNENFKPEPEKTEKPEKPVKQQPPRRKSIWVELNEEINMAEKQINIPELETNVLKPNLDENIESNKEKEENLEPIVLKACRSIKTKSRRKTICSEERFQIVEPPEENNTDSTNQTFKLRVLRRKSVCAERAHPPIDDPNSISD